MSRKKKHNVLLNKLLLAGTPKWGLNSFFSSCIKSYGMSQQKLLVNGHLKLI